MKRPIALLFSVLISSIAYSQDSDQSTKQQDWGGRHRVIEGHIATHKAFPRQLIIGTNPPTDLKEYLAEVRNKIERSISLDNSVEAQRCSNSRADIEFEISADGTLGKVKIVISSGCMVTDQAAVRSIELAAPFPPFAAEMKQKADSIIVIKPIRFVQGKVSVW